MAGKYWDKGLTLVSGCTKISPACDNCWALAMEHRFKKGDGTVTFHEDRLDRLKTKKPTIFSIWNDLFHKDVTLGQIYKAWNTFELFEHHTFLVLTKRPERVPALKLPSLDNVYIGATIESYDTLLKRMSHVISLKKQGHKTFISAEPLLDFLDIGSDIKHLDWVICGRETGTSARIMRDEWAEQLLDTCQKYNVPFYFKQGNNGRLLKGQEWNETPW